MSEVLGVMGLEALVCLLLGLAAFRGGVAAIDWKRRSWLRKARVVAEIAAYLCWANFVLGFSLAPRYLHGSTLATGAGRMPDGSYVVVDQYGDRNPVTEAEFRQRSRYERWSLQLPWYVTPPAALLILVGRLGGGRNRPGLRGLGRDVRYG